MRQETLWRVKPRDWQGVNRLVNALGISPFSAQLLINRGIADVESARDFFETPLERLSALESIPGCMEAAQEIAGSLRNGERVMIYGDYDADGVTATSVMVKGLRLIGAHPDFYIPDRFAEGYDLNEGFIRSAADKGYGLIITVDCGIKALGCVETAKGLGLKVIVTDHHEPGDELPEPEVLINPKLNDDAFVRDLAGVGVALAVVLAVFKEMGFQPTEAAFRQLLELAAIGTIADSVALTGCNRIIVKHGLKLIGRSSNTGLASLLEVEGLKDKGELDVNDISYKIAPCINAVGRIGDANDAVSLLVSESPQEAWELARKLHHNNSVRQNLDGAVFLEVLERVRQEVDFDSEKVIVLAAEDWHPGVIGITAARVAQRFNMPTVLISLDGDIGKGSARSPGNFDLHRAFNYCQELLLKWGGHKLAGGLSISVDNIPDFRRKINEFALMWCEEEQLCPKEVDAEVIMDEISFKLLEEIETFKPFGVQNPEPVFLCRNVRVDKKRLVGKKAEHLKLLVSSEDIFMDCIGFKMPEHMEMLKEGSFAHLVFTPRSNTWNGSTKIELHLLDILYEDDMVCCPGENPRHWPGKQSGSNPGDIVQNLLKGGRIQYSGLDADRALLDTIYGFREEGEPGVILFPLQSIAADFERTLAGLPFDLKAIRLDCIAARETIHRAAYEITGGNANLLITSLGTWLANENLREAAAKVQSCMCIHLGHWGASSIPEDILGLAGKALAGWKNPAAVFGSGREFDRDQICNSLGISQVKRGKGVPDANLRLVEEEDRVDFIRELLSSPGKQLVFVNNGRKAIRLTRQIREKGMDTFRIRHFHGSLTPSQKKLVLEDFNFGLAKGLVASRNLEPYMVESPSSVALYSFPLNVFDFNRFVIAPTVFLGYNNADFREACDYVYSLCPNEELLRNSVEDIEQNGKRNKAEFAKLMAAGLQRNGNSGKRGVSVALAILGDIYSGSSGSFDMDSFFRSWRYVEARREVEAFELLLDTMGRGQKEAAAALETTPHKFSS